MIKENEVPHIPVFLSSDDNYAPFAATTIASICYNTKSFIDFYMLDGGISEINKGKINSLKTQFNNFTIEFIKIDVNKAFKEFKTNEYITLSTYNRFLIPQLKPDLGKVIYLDVDIAALGDIAMLYNEDLSSYSLAAILESFSISYIIKKFKFAMDISAEHRYFNAGVLLIDIQKWRNDNITQRLFDIEKIYRDKLHWADQDVLNKCFDCNYQILDNKYNFQTSGEKEISPPQNIIIRHFDTIWKPWNSNGIYGEAVIDHFNDFWLYASMTPFLLSLLRASGFSSGGNPKYPNRLLARREIINRARRNIIQQSKSVMLSSANFLVSVIIPAYNVEFYLKKCLDSVLAQTYKNLEIICVDDCSTDNCGEILWQYAQKDQRITIITHSVNKGLGAARNTGLKAARGKYIYFIDSDDWLSDDYIDSMVSAVEHSDEAEIILNTNILTSKNEQFLPHIVPDVKNAYLPAKTSITKVIWNVWAHFYKRSFLEKNQILFDESICVCEDAWFQFITYIYTEKIYVIRGGVYHYLIRLDSITNTQIDTGYKNIDKNIAILNKIYDYYQTAGLFNKHDIKMFTREIIPHYTMNQKQKAELCTKLRNYFDKIKEHVSERWYLYDEFELLAFYCILDGQGYAMGNVYSKTVLSKLRHRVK